MSLLHEVTPYGVKSFYDSYECRDSVNMSHCHRVGELLNTLSMLSRGGKIGFRRVSKSSVLLQITSISFRWASLLLRILEWRLAPGDCTVGCLLSSSGKINLYFHYTVVIYGFVFLIFSQCSILILHQFRHFF